MDVRRTPLGALVGGPVTPPDVVIPVRPGDRNEQLRYALRTLQNTPHGTVWVAGHVPPWVRNVRPLPRTQELSAQENSSANLLVAASQPEMADEFLLWNDDFYLLRPVQRVPLVHRGPMTAKSYPQGNRYGRYAARTLEVLRRLGHSAPLWYEAHVPMPFRRAELEEALSRVRALGEKPPLLMLRSLYGNASGAGGERIQDVKIHSEWQSWDPEGETFLSTTERTFAEHPAGAYVRDLYTSPGPYESRY